MAVVEEASLFLVFLELLMFSSWRKSRRTVLLHLGHLGSSSESITYIRQRGHPTRTIDVASGLFEYLRVSPELISDETHELGCDVGEFDDEDADRLGDSILARFTRGGDRFSFKSSFGHLPFLLILTLRKEAKELGIQKGRNRELQWKGRNHHISVKRVFFYSYQSCLCSTGAIYIMKLRGEMRLFL